MSTSKDQALLQLSRNISHPRMLGSQSQEQVGWKRRQGYVQPQIPE